LLNLFSLQSTNGVTNCNGYVAFADILADPSSCCTYDGFCLTDYLNSTLACSTTDDDYNNNILQYTCPTIVEQTLQPVSSCVADCIGYVAFSDVLANASQCYNWENYCLTDYPKATLGCDADDTSYDVFYICPTIIPQALPAATCALDCHGYVSFADVLTNPIYCFNSESYYLTDEPFSVLGCLPTAYYELDYYCPIIMSQPSPPWDDCTANCLGYVAFSDVLADPSTCGQYQDYCLSDYLNSTLSIFPNRDMELSYTCPTDPRN
jgi:hypothetical protein